MDICEYSDVVNAQLVIRYYPNQGSRFSCHFENGEIKEGGILSSIYGNDVTPVGAMNDYVSKIRGKRIIFNATLNSRREFDIPKYLDDQTEEQ